MLFANDTPQSRRFREDVRGWLATSLPAAYRNQMQVLDPTILRDWQRRLHARGWVAPAWPVEHGGMGASIDEQLIMLEELARAGAPPVLPTGINLLGHALMAYGTAEQRAFHLPRILDGTIFWAQGYTEPEAGSDLASLRTRADACDGGFVVTGEKIWSSFAHFCDWIFALVRTDPGAKPRHAGISMLLIDLRSPGITVRPIRTIAGRDEFASVHFDRVVVPRANQLGTLNDGWRVANHVLVFERLANGNPRHALAMWHKVRTVAAATGAQDDVGFRDRLAMLEMRLLAHLALYRRAVEHVKAGTSIDDVAPVMKIVATEILQALTELLLEAGEAHGVPAAFPLPDRTLELAGEYLLARRTTIFGGSNEIQRNIVANRVLGFPRTY
jgi:alkylation response protein AidB-like acyl-CoA dehydrogenase